MGVKRRGGGADQRLREVRIVAETKPLKFAVLAPGAVLVMASISHGGGYVFSVSITKPGYILANKKLAQLIAGKSPKMPSKSLGYRCANM